MEAKSFCGNLDKNQVLVVLKAVFLSVWAKDAPYSRIIWGACSKYTSLGHIHLRLTDLDSPKVELGNLYS